MQMIFNCHILVKITGEPPALPPVEHAGAHILNAPLFERKYARVYLGGPESREAAGLRTQIAKGACEALEDQYWEAIERVIQARPMEARLGGDPSVSNKVRAFLGVKYYKNGQWEDRIEVGRCSRLTWNATLTRSYLACGRTATMGQVILSFADWPRTRGSQRSHTVPGCDRAP